MKANQKEFWETIRKRRTPNHLVIKAFVEPKIEFIAESVNFTKDLKILDVGCGNGFFTYNFSKFAYTVGLDYSRYMLSINPCNPLVQGYALLLPFKTNTFDVVFCSNLLHHIEKPEKVINEMKRVSKRFVILSEPNRNNPLMALFSAIVPEERGALRFSLKYMERQVELCGLKTIDSSSMGSIVPNKTPSSLLAVFKRIDGKNPIGFYTVVVASK